jgi:hypothetical protein
MYAVGVPHPAFPRIRPSVPIRRITTSRYKKFHSHFNRPLYDGLEVINLEPQQHAIVAWFVITVTGRAVMVCCFETVQLQHKLAM